jgi:hypothetical protein
LEDPDLFANGRVRVKALATDNGLTGGVDAQAHLAFPMRKYQKAV